MVSTPVEIINCFFSSPGCVEVLASSWLVSVSMFLAVQTAGDCVTGRWGRLSIAHHLTVEVDVAPRQGGRRREVVWRTLRTGHLSLGSWTPLLFNGMCLSLAGFAGWKFSLNLFFSLCLYIPSPLSLTVDSSLRQRQTKCQKQNHILFRLNKGLTSQNKPLTSSVQSFNDQTQQIPKGSWQSPTDAISDI